MTLNSNYFHWINLVKAIAIIGVVAIHSYSGVIHDYELAPNSKWWTANIVNAITRWVVPVFVMISGSLLLKERETESTGLFLKKRFTRVGLPLLFWSVVYFFWSQIEGNAYTINDFLKKTLVYGQPYFHLYFIFLIAGLYLITPLIRVFWHNATEADKRYSLILSLSLGSLVMFFETWYQNHWYFGSLLSISYFVPYIGYFLAGEYLTHVRLNKKLFLAALLTLIFTFFITAMGYHYLNILYDNARLTWFHNFLSPNVMASSFLIFLIFVNYTHWVPDWLLKNRIVGLVGECSFGIYLIHPIILNSLGSFLEGSINNNYTEIVAMTVTVVFSLLFTVVVRSIPYLRTVALGIK